MGRDLNERFIEFGGVLWGLLFVAEQFNSFQLSVTFHIETRTIYKIQNINYIPYIIVYILLYTVQIKSLVSIWNATMVWNGLKTLNRISSTNPNELPLYKKWNFQLRISSVNTTKSTEDCEFGDIYWKNPWWKTLWKTKSKKLVLYF